MENDKMINFSTRDLVLATYLRYNNIDLIEGYQPNNKSWVFSNPDECIKLSLKLKNGKAEVVAIAGAARYSRDMKPIFAISPESPESSPGVLT